MAKAILVLQMPESCWQCELYSTAHNCCNVIVIVGHYAICPSKGRRPDCPLKLVKENAIAAWNSRTGNDIVVRGEWKLYGNDDDLGMSYWCSACNFQLSEDLFYSDIKMADG